MDKLELIIFEKEEELKCLQQQAKEALQWEADADFEYMALLYPVIGRIKREIEKMKALQQVAETVGPDNFTNYVNQLLYGEFQSLEIHANLNNWRENYDFIILVISKMKSKNTLLCTIQLNVEMENYLHHNFQQVLQHIGWKFIKTGNRFQLKFVVNNIEAREEFNRIIAQTMIEPFSSLLKSAEQHFYKLVSYRNSGNDK